MSSHRIYKDRCKSQAGLPKSDDASHVRLTRSVISEGSFDNRRIQPSAQSSETLKKVRSGDVSTSERIIMTPNKKFGFDCGTLYRGTSWDTAMWKKEDTLWNTSSNAGEKAVPKRDDSINGSETRSTYTDSLSGNEVDLSSIQSQHTDISRGSSRRDFSSNGEENSDEQERSLISSREEADSEGNIADFTHYNMSHGGTEETSGASEEEKDDYPTDVDMSASSSEDGERIASPLDSEREKNGTSLSRTVERKHSSIREEEKNSKNARGKRIIPKGGAENSKDSISKEERNIFLPFGGSPNISVSRESLVYDSNSEMLESGRSRESTTDTGRSGRSRESTPDAGRSGRSQESIPDTGCYRVYTPKNPDASPSTPYFFNPVILLDRNEILDNVHLLIKERDYYERELDAATIAIRCLKLERDILTEQLKAALRLNGEKSVTLVKYIVEFHQSILEDGDGQTRILVDRPPVRYSTKTTFCLHECTDPNPPGGKYSTQFKKDKWPPRKNYTETRPKHQNPYSRKFSTKVSARQGPEKKSKPTSRKPCEKSKSKRSVPAQKDLSQRPPWDDSCFFIPKENKHKRNPSVQKSKPLNCSKTQNPTLEKDQSAVPEIINKSDGNSRVPLKVDERKAEIENLSKLLPITRDLRNIPENDPINTELPPSAFSKDSVDDHGSIKSQFDTSEYQGNGAISIDDNKVTSQVSTTRMKPVDQGLGEGKEYANDGAGDQIVSLVKAQKKEQKECVVKPCKPVQRPKVASDGTPQEFQPINGMSADKPPKHRPPIYSSAKSNLTKLPPIAEKTERPTSEMPSTITDPHYKSHPLKDSTRAQKIIDTTKSTKKMNHHVNRTLDRLPPIAQPAVRLQPSTKSTKKESKGPRLLPPLHPGRISLVSRGPDKAPTPPKAEKPNQQRPFLGRRLS